MLRPQTTQREGVNGLEITPAGQASQAIFLPPPRWAPTLAQFLTILVNILVLDHDFGIKIVLLSLPTERSPLALAAAGIA